MYKWTHEYNASGRSCYKLSTARFDTAGYVLDFRKNGKANPLANKVPATLQHGPDPNSRWKVLPYFSPFGIHWARTFNEGKGLLCSLYVKYILDSMDK